MKFLYNKLISNIKRNIIKENINKPYDLKFFERRI